MKYVSLFSGIEAATVAWEPLGWEPACFAEFDEFPSAVLAERYPEVPNIGDVTKMNWKKYRGKVDLVVGGSPCQSFSIAGKREGLQGESGLMFEYIRAVREIRPRWFLWENVPGALSSENGEAFRQLLSEMDKLGYGLAWRILDAQFFGVAQRRRRLFLVGHLGACPPIGVLIEPESMRGDLESSAEKRASLAEEAATWLARSRLAATRRRCACERLHAARPLRMRGRGGKGALVSDEVSLTLSTSNTQTLFSEEGGGMVVRRLTPRECERLQGFPDDWTKIPYRGKPAEECPDGPRYKAIGNSMAVPVMRWIGERIAMAEAGEIA